MKAAEPTVAAPAATDLMPLPDRFVALDIFRGITITAMILVNNPGSWSYVYPPLLHAEWHGWTPTDLIFPFFLFIVGVAMAFSFHKRLSRGITPRRLYPKIIRRSVLLFLLGLFLNLIPIDIPEGYNWFRDTFLNVRIPGVLQRIAVVYLLTAMLVLHFRTRALVYWGVGLLAVYWLVMKTVPFTIMVDGQPVRYVGILEPGLNLAAYVDDWLLRGHTWLQGDYLHYDPEGVLSTIPAVATCISGVLVGMLLLQKKSQYEKVADLFFWGALGLALGQILHGLFPINKNLWSPSYVVFTSGFAAVFLAMCIYVADIRGHRRWAKPFVIFGVNALAYFMLAGIFTRILLLIRVGEEGVRLKTWLYQSIFAPLFGPMNGSLAFAIFYIIFWLGIMTLLYRKRIFIKL